jgi:hypothetical protein
MKAELQLTLISRYPDLLDLETGVWGPGMSFTFLVGAAGWFDLIDRLFRDIMAIAKSRGSAGPICRITDVKEKMGELRIVCEGADEQIRDLIHEARLESVRTCQVCGKPGTLRIIEGLAATLCDADAERLEQAE